MSVVSRGAGMTARADAELRDVTARSIGVQPQGSAQTRRRSVTTSHSERTGHTGPSADRICGGAA